MDICRTSGIMTACTPDEKEGMFSGKGEPVTVKFSIDTRVAETDDFDSQVKRSGCMLSRMAARWGIIMAGRMCRLILLNGNCRREKSGFMQWPMSRRLENCFAKTREIFLCCPVRLPEAYIRVEGLEVTPDKLESLTFSRLPEAEYVSGGTETGKDETGKIYCSAIVPMTGKCRETVANDHQEIKLVLKRSVAKLNLYFAKADVTDAGKGQLYMGRGLYLYNIPEYGYLFPKEKYEYTGAFNCLEGAGDSSDSRHQKNGKVILSAGWPEEPENAPQEGTDAYEEYEQNLKEKTHINEINALAHAGNTDPEQFQWSAGQTCLSLANLMG